MACRRSLTPPLLPSAIEAGTEAPGFYSWEEEERVLHQDSVTVLRLTLQNDPSGSWREPVKQKPVGKAFAMVANKSTNSHSLASECIKSNDGHEEIIKVYLRGRGQEKAKPEESISQLKRDVRYVQEARTSLKNLREEISNKPENPQGAKSSLQPAQVTLEKQNGVWHPESLHTSSVDQEEDYVGEDVEKIRETAKRLFTRLQETEKRHQLDRKAFETTVSQYQREVEQNTAARGRAEERAAAKEAEVEELQRLVLGMEKEHQSLLKKMKESEDELEKLRSLESDRLTEQERSAKLEKEVAMLREKIHHLDDMLKSQQRKVRHMIEQLQNSKTVIQAKDEIIQELREQVAHLTAENLEMHERIDHLIEKQINLGSSSFSSRPRSKSEYVSSKSLAGPLKPKPLPLIRVVET